jgi:hypothetical protein
MYKEEFISAYNKNDWSKCYSIIRESIYKRKNLNIDNLLLGIVNYKLARFDEAVRNIIFSLQLDLYEKINTEMNLNDTVIENLMEDLFLNHKDQLMVLILVLVESSFLMNLNLNEIRRIDKSKRILIIDRLVNGKTISSENYDILSKQFKVISTEILILHFSLIRTTIFTELWRQPI